MAKKEISWILRAKDSVSTVLNRVGKRFKSFATTGLKYAKMLALGFVAMGAAAFAMGAKLVSAFQGAAQAEAKLTAVLRATGYAAGYTTGQLKDQAAELQKLTGIDGDLIISMQGILAGFRNISGENFQEATKAILDMSTVLQKAGQDEAAIEQASIQVGKALNDPIKGISALSRVGVTFTEQQKAQIKAMQEAGDMAGAQKIILEELKNEFGGAAEGIDSNVKSYRVFMAALGDAGEEIGRAITDNLSLSETFDKLTKIIENLVESGEIEYWAEQVADAVNSVLPMITPLINGFSKLNRLMKEMGGMAGGLLEGMSFEDAAALGIQTADELEKTKEARLKQIREERDARKKARDEEEQAEMKAAQAKQKSVDKTNKEAGNASEIKKITDDLDHKIKLQELLNKGLKTEAELLKIQKQLNRELTEEEKKKLAAKIEALKKAEEENGLKKLSYESKFDDKSIGLERIGAIYRGADDIKKDDKKELKDISKNTKEQTKILNKLLEKKIGAALENV
ncbi:MAG: hypothetical protein WC373_01810 [Smithella sp.]|jgi:hypothetical protein